MEKKVTNEVIEKIAEGMRKDFEFILFNLTYEYYYAILQEAIVEVTEMDETSKTIDINEEFEYYINEVLEEMEFPSIKDLDDASKALINTLYNDFVEHLRGVIDDVEDEYSDVDIDIEDKYIVVTREY
jgi:hypothetical protein